MSRPRRARGRLLCLLGTLALTAVLGRHAARIGIEHDNASLNADDPVRRRVDATFAKTFGSAEDLLLGVRHPRLLERDGLALVATLSGTVAAWEGVHRVWSPTTIEELVAGETGVTPRPLLEPPWDGPDVAARARAAFDRNPDLTGWLVSPERDTAGIVIELAERPGDSDHPARLIAGLRELVARHTTGDVSLHLTGVPVQKHDVSLYVDRDQRLLLPLAVVVLGATLTAFFRHWSGVAVPLGVAGITVTWTLGACAWSGYALNAITSLLPPMLLVIALAASLHLYHAWRTAPGAGADGRPDPIACAAVARRAVALPMTLCALTTAQGFLSLTVNDIPAVRQLGFFVALGATVACLVGLTAAPAALSYFQRPAPAPREQHRHTARLLSAATRLAITRPRAVLVAFGLITLVAAAGIPRIRANTDLVGFLRPDAPLRRDTAILDQAFGGTIPLEFVLHRRDGRPLDSPETIRRLASLEDDVRGLPGVATVTSVVALVRQVHRAETGGNQLTLPSDEPALRDALDLLDASGHPLVRRFAAAEMRALRVTVRVRAMGTAESAPLLAAIAERAKRRLGPEYRLLPTGAFYRLIRDSTRLVREQLRSLAVAVVLIVVTIGILFHSIRLTAVAMLPNVLPLLWVTGLMGWARIDLSTGTAMIASAVLGLVVDSTVHYLAHYRRTYRGNTAAAIEATTSAVGPPITVAAASLVLGFWVGAFGSFSPTVHFSLLAGVAMASGVACDLLVLPATLVLFDRRRRTQSA